MGAHPSKSPSSIMCMLTYSPRPDVDAHAYEEWAREVDNPLFMSIPGIAWYESWKVHSAKNGWPSFAYFDTMYIESEAALEQVWSNETLREFAHQWTVRWGRAPQHPDEAVNYHVLVCEEIAGQKVAGRSEWCVMLNYTPRADAQQLGYDKYLREIDNPFFNSDEVPEIIASSNWRRKQDMQGTEWWTDFDLMLVDGPDGYEKILANAKAAEFAGNWARNWGHRPEDGIPANLEALVGELIASPLKR